MFVKDTDNGLAFIKSKSIKVFPCGRRRSEIIDPDNNSATVSDQYYLPFDPEARLNTEANNRKHSGLNGYKQSYLNYWRELGGKSQLSFVIAGYLFDIEVEFSPTTGDAPTAFGNELITVLGVSGSVNSLYANIKLADIEFFSGINGNASTAAKTTILRDQSLGIDEQPASCLDKYSGNDDTNTLNPEHYYFYGLSFSTDDLSDKFGTDDYVSLQLLARRSNESGIASWVIPEQSRLPSIDHGTVENSIKVGIIQADEINIAGDLNVNGMITQDGDPVVTANIVEQPSTGMWQLQFKNVTKIESK